MSDDEANLAHVFQNQSNLRGYMAGAIARQSEIDGADTDARVGAWAQAASTAVSAVPLPQTKAAGVALDAGTKFALNAGKSAAAQGAESGIGSLFGGHEDKAKSENEKAGTRDRRRTPTSRCSPYSVAASTPVKSWPP